MTENQITVKEIQTHYKVYGQGRSFLILHGWNSSSASWEKLADTLAQNNLQVIVPDLPGFGQSQTLPSAWNLDAYVDWVHEFTQKVPELSKDFYLLGHSFGGAIAVKFTIKYNQRIQKLFLIAAACIREKTFLKKVYYALAKIIKLFSFVPYYPLARKAFYKFVIKKSDYLSTYGRSPEGRQAGGVMQETYLRIISEDLSHRVRFVKVPTLLVWGSKDDLTPLEQGQIIHQKIRGSILEVIPNIKHSIQREVPEVLAQKIIENL